ncbi:MAG: N-acetylneuraminate synthase family protein [Planctomycetota bacterium]
MMQIGDRTVGSMHPVYVIAEIGVNHDGDPSRALELTDAAADAGADAVKLQLFETDRLMSSAAKLAAYQKSAGEQDPLSMLRRLELSIDDMAPIVERAHSRGVHALVSVFSVELVDDATTLPWDAFKTASPDIINKPLLEALAGTGLPLIISTGASTLGEVERALTWLTPIRDRLAVLQCVSSYPTSPEDASLDGIAALEDIVDGPVGYSDHCTGVLVGGDAVEAGAAILEKHLTYDTRATGPDHAASLDPASFHTYVEIARSRIHGATRHVGEKRLLPAEHDVRTVSRQSLTTARPIAAGQTIDPGDLTIKRPGTGIEPFRLNEIIGRVTRSALEADVPLVDEHLQ